MRELKFRAWDVESECYIDEKDWAGITPEGQNIWLVEEGELSVLPILGEFIIEQYTGLKDKNGKEIYEGDIVKVYKMFDAIAVDYDAGGFVLRNEDWDCVVPMSRDIDDDVLGVWLGDKCTTVEVIGNIHENPELLKGGEE